MILRDATKELLHRAKLTYKEVSDKAGAKSASFVTTPLTKNDMHVSTLLKMCDICGYDLCLVNRDKEKLEYPIVIESTERVMEVERLKSSVPENALTE